MAGGRWQVAGGEWQVAGGRWQMAGGRWLPQPALSPCHLVLPSSFPPFILSLPQLPIHLIVNVRLIERAVDLLALGHHIGEEMMQAIVENFVDLPKAQFGL